MKAAAVCYRRDTELQYLLVRTKGGGYWIFPKGGVEPDEEPWQAATREAREEAGAEGSVSRELLTTFAYHVGSKRTRKVRAFLLEVSNPDALRPEETCREPRWFDAQAAAVALREGRDANEWEPLVDVLELATQSVV